MNLESIRTFCKRLPHVTEDIKWGHDLCFLIGGKMFAVASLDTAEGHCLSFKCTPEEFAELVEVNGIVPAPYMARNHWVMMEKYDALRDAEVEAFVTRSYAMVKAKLTKSALAALGEATHHGGTEARRKAKAKEVKAKTKAKTKVDNKAKADRFAAKPKRK
jgi:predicted DNA-binding protein (MmcQ/YjbR family)